MPEYTLDQFAAFLEAAAGRAPRETEKVVRKGADRVKIGARNNVRQTAPVHNAGAQKYITYDVTARGVVVDAEVGYEKRGGGNLGNLLEYGGGGDHSPPHLDLSRAVDDEEPRLGEALLDMGEELLD